MVQYTTATSLIHYVPLTPTEVIERARQLQRATYARYINPWGTTTAKR